MKRIVIKSKIAEDTIEIDSDKTIEISNCPIQRFICIRTSGNFAKKSFRLTNDYDWRIGVDSEGYKIVIPITK